MTGVLCPWSLGFFGSYKVVGLGVPSKGHSQSLLIRAVANQLGASKQTWSVTNRSASVSAVGQHCAFPVRSHGVTNASGFMNHFSSLEPNGGAQTQDAWDTWDLVQVTEGSIGGHC